MKSWTEFLIVLSVATLIGCTKKEPNINIASRYPTPFDVRTSIKENPIEFEEYDDEYGTTWQYCYRSDKQSITKQLVEEFKGVPRVDSISVPDRVEDVPGKPIKWYLMVDGKRLLVGITDEKPGESNRLEKGTCWLSVTWFK